MNNVLDFARHQGKPDQEEHLRGKARCLHCRREWEAVAPVGTVSGLECPECNLPKGVLVGLVGAAEGKQVWTCNCDCNVFYLTPDAINCLNCGATQTGMWE